MENKPPITGTAETIQWENFVRFVRQLNHDLRNQLNAAELQGALLSELTTDPELKAEVARLRELVSHLGSTLQRLSLAVAPPQITRFPYSAKDLMNDLQAKVAHDFPEHCGRVRWDISLNGAMLDIDPGLIGWAAAELFDNAFRHDGAEEISARGRESSGQFIFALHEPKKNEIDPAKWSEALSAVKQGHYGLGLRRARAIVAAHDGELTSDFDPKSSMLISRIVLPCSQAESPETSDSSNSNR